MLIEPTETEPKRELDRFAAVMIALAERVNAGDVQLEARRQQRGPSKARR